MKSNYDMLKLNILNKEIYIMPLVIFMKHSNFNNNNNDNNKADKTQYYKKELWKVSLAYH